MSRRVSEAAGDRPLRGARHISISSLIAGRGLAHLLIEPPVEREQASDDRQDQQVDAVQHADDQQDPADARRLVLQLRRGDGVAQSVRVELRVNRMYAVKIR